MLKLGLLMKGLIDVGYMYLAGVAVTADSTILLLVCCCLVVDSYCKVCR